MRTVAKIDGFGRVLFASFGPPKWINIHRKQHLKLSQINRQTNCDLTCDWIDLALFHNEDSVARAMRAGEKERSDTDPAFWAANLQGIRIVDGSFLSLY